MPSAQNVSASWPCAITLTAALVRSMQECRASSWRVQSEAEAAAPHRDVSSSQDRTLRGAAAICRACRYRLPAASARCCEEVPPLSESKVDRSTARHEATESGPNMGRKLWRARQVTCVWRSALPRSAKSTVADGRWPMVAPGD
eukprot:4924599-Prymnesium_polylepis.1